MEEGKTEHTDSTEMNKNSIKKQMWQMYIENNILKQLKLWKICNIEEC